MEVITTCRCGAECINNVHSISNTFYFKCGSSVITRRSDVPKYLWIISKECAESTKFASDVTVDQPLPSESKCSVIDISSKREQYVFT
jgi:hypothetical protein